MSSYPRPIVAREGWPFVTIALAVAIGVTCVQIAGLIARRVRCYAKQGGRLARGQRYGFIRFGSRVDVYLPRRLAEGCRRRQGVRDRDDRRRAMTGGLSAG